MAAPITHIVLAEKIFDKYFSTKNKKEFYVGTSFPDIRYLGVIDREKTHFDRPNIGDILNSESFLAGMKFHSLVDQVRESFMLGRNLYSLFPKSQFCTQAIKVFEDGVLRGKIGGWDGVAHIFDDIDNNELEFGVEKADIARWHLLLRHYFSRPSNETEFVRRFIEDMGRPKEMADEMIRVLKGLKDKAKAEEIVNDFYNSFEELMEEYGLAQST